MFTKDAVAAFGRLRGQDVRVRGKVRMAGGLADFTLMAQAYEDGLAAHNGGSPVCVTCFARSRRAFRATSFLGRRYTPSASRLGRDFYGLSLSTTLSFMSSLITRSSRKTTKAATTKAIQKHLSA